MPSGRTTWHVRGSVVPQHIGVVKINTVTPFGKKKKDSRPSLTASIQLSPEASKRGPIFTTQVYFTFIRQFFSIIKKEMTIKVKS